MAVGRSRIVKAAPVRMAFDLQGAEERARRGVDEIEQIKVGRDTICVAIEDHDRPLLGVGHKASIEVGVDGRLAVLRNLQMNLCLGHRAQREDGQSDNEAFETLSYLPDFLLVQLRRSECFGRIALSRGLKNWRVEKEWGRKWNIACTLPFNFSLSASS